MVTLSSSARLFVVDDTLITPTTLFPITSGILKKELTSVGFVFSMGTPNINSSICSGKFVTRACRDASILFLTWSMKLELTLSST